MAIDHVSRILLRKIRQFMRYCTEGDVIIHTTMATVDHTPKQENLQLCSFSSK